MYCIVLIFISYLFLIFFLFLFSGGELLSISQIINGDSKEHIQQCV